MIDDAEDSTVAFRRLHDIEPGHGGIVDFQFFLTQFQEGSFHLLPGFSSEIQSFYAFGGSFSEVLLRLRLFLEDSEAEAVPSLNASSYSFFQKVHIHLLPDDQRRGNVHDGFMHGVFSGQKNTHLTGG